MTVQTIDDNAREGTETFNVNLSNATNATIADGHGRGDDPGHNDQVIDADGQVIVSGPTKAKAGSKTYSFKVTNNGTGPLTLDLGTDITGSVTVDGVTSGTVAGPTGTDTINPGKSVKYKMVWTHGDLATGLPVVFSACVPCRVTLIPRPTIAVARRGSPLAELAVPRWRDGRAEGLRPSARPASQEQPEERMG